jgi:hypothetical protein
VSTKRFPGHTLYWVYAYWPGDYNFDTTTQLKEAKKILREFVAEMPTEVFIFYGNEDGAFTHVDPVVSWRKDK